MRAETTLYRGMWWCSIHLAEQRREARKRRASLDKEAPLQVVTARDPRVQKYLVVVTLACGHITSYSVSADRVSDPRAHPKRIRCYRCGNQAAQA